MLILNQMKVCSTPYSVYLCDAKCCQRIFCKVCQILTIIIIIILLLKVLFYVLQLEIKKIFP